MLSTRTDNILQVFDTYIELPSGRQLTLDCYQQFTPNREFWQLWRDHKLDVKRAGVFVGKDESDRWRGYVRDVRNGFSYLQPDTHAYWKSKAEQMAATDDCEPVIVKADTLASDVPRPCRREPGHTDFRVDAKKCKNDTYQIRLHCDRCESKTPGAISWNKLGSDIVIRSIAHAEKREKRYEGIEWV